MTVWTATAKNALLLLGAGGVLGWLMGVLDPGATSGANVALYGSFIAIALLAGWLIWTRLGATRRVGWLTIAAFLVRLAVGVALALILPGAGNDTPTHNSGYIFYDAFIRDNQAWTLASSGAPLTSALDDQFYGDQYGGMLMMSAAVYRLFSPDLHRSWLIIIITAFISSVGSLFLFKALLKRFGEKVAFLATLIFAFYPESILLGASQMRDPILIGLGAVAFYLVERWQDNRWKNLIWFVLVMAILAAFSWLIAVAFFAMLTIWWWIDFSANLSDRRRRLMGWAFIVLVAIGGLSVLSQQLREFAAYDLGQAVRNSGWIAALFTSLPETLQTPFIVIYGLFQPVLPAAIFDPSIPVMTIISTVLSLGWYLLIPVLLYAPIALLRIEKGVVRRLLISALAGFLIWSLISSLRAGGDLWDNPRYRTLFIPWLSLVAAWAWDFARRTKDAWLGRWYLVMGIFLAFFTNWYLYRIYNYGLLIDFWPMIGMIIGLSLLVLGWGVVKEIKLRGNPFTNTE